MRRDGTNRALEVLGDYLFELEALGKDRGGRTWTSRTVSARQADEPPKLPDQDPSDLLFWWKRKLREFKRRRVLREHTIALTHKLTPWRLVDVARLWPRLGTFDHLALLINLDGVVPGGFMDAHENIRAAIEEIVEESVKRHTRKEVAVLFGEVAEQVRADKTSFVPHGGGKKRPRCTTCQGVMRKQDDGTWKCLKCEPKEEA